MSDICPVIAPIYPVQLHSSNPSRFSIKCYACCAATALNIYPSQI